MEQDASQGSMMLDSQNYARLVRAIMMDLEADIRTVLSQQKLGGFTDDTGRNPLHIAALHERKNVVAPLIQAGVDPNQVNADGLTALDIAADHDPKFYQQMIRIVKNEYQRKVRQKMAKTPSFMQKVVVSSSSKLYGDD